MEFRILGHLEVSAGDSVVDVGGHRQRALLVLLLLEANRAISVARLADRLWDGRPPRRAAGTIHAYISNLRRALEPMRPRGAPSSILTRDPSGYVLRVDPDLVDAARFERLVREGQEALTTHNPDTASQLLDEALSLWRGAALADVAMEPFAQTAAARLEGLRAVAIEDSIQAALDQGRHREIVPDLEKRVADEPLREGLRAKLMLALYRSGRQADALARYQDGRRVLADQLGIDPGPSLRALEEAILSHDPSLDWQPVGQTQHDRTIFTLTGSRPPSATERQPLAVQEILRTETGGPHERLVLDQPHEPAPGAPGSAVPMPSLLTDVGPIFVGRKRELKRLEALWSDARAGARRLALVAGEPGAGKTRLAVELAQAVHATGATVLAGRCDEDLGVPYQPFVEALHHVVDHVPPQDLCRHLGRYAQELTRLVPELASLVPDLPSPLRSDPDTARYRLFDAVATWLEALAADAPLLLILDDLQWAAKPTLLLARHVLRSPHVRRVLVLGTYRDTELSQNHPLMEFLADLRRQPGVERFPLKGLDEHAVLTLMARSTGGDVPGESLALARAIRAETAGNPFFVREMLRHLRDTKVLEQLNGHWSIRLPLDKVGIPEGVREVVGRRLARLSDETNRVLRVAALMGTEFELSVVQAAEGLDEETLLRALDEALETRLVLELPGPVPSYRFAHALVRDTLSEKVSTVRRMRIHRHLAEAIENLHADHLDQHVPALARHYAEACTSPADAAKVVTYATRAGDRALAQLAHDEAVVYYQQALGILALAEGTSDTRRLDLLIALGKAQHRAGHPAHRETLLAAAELARDCGDADALARAALANFRGLWSHSGKADTERIAALEAALDAAGPAASRSRARLLANLAVELYFSSDAAQRRALSDEALALARRLGDPLTLARVLHARLVVIWEPGTIGERQEATGELVALADSLGDPAIAAWSYVWRFIATTEIANLDEADHSLSRLTALTNELNQPLLSWVAAYLTAERALLAGRLSEAETLGRRASEMGKTLGQPDARMFFGTQRFQICYEHGHLAEIVDRLAGVPEEARRPETRALLALAYCELNQYDDARRVFEPLAATLADLPLTLEWLQIMTTCASICAHLRDTSVASRLLEYLAPYGEQAIGHPILCWARWGCVSHYLGLLTACLGRWDEADGHFAAAAATHDRIGAPTWLARTHVEWGQMLLSRRNPEDVPRARELLGRAQTAAHELGLPTVERRASDLLQERP